MTTLQNLEAVAPAHAAWTRFILDGELDPGAVPPEIAHAWRRCRANGVDPLAGRSTRTLPGPELARLLEKHRNLIEVARPFMAHLYQFVASSSFVVLLCDECGYVLEASGAPGLIAEAPLLNFAPGALWSEAEIGNNGVGTALQLQRPFQVSGAEHYCRKHHPWTCSGAPIFDEQGRMAGILELSGPVEETHEHTLGMVVAAAEAIRQQLRIQAKNRELTLLNSHLNSLFLTVSDGVAVVDPRGLIQQLNPVAEKLLAGRAADLIGQSILDWLDKPGPVQQLLATGRLFSDLEFHVGKGPERMNCLVSAKGVNDDQGNLARAVLFLNPTHRMNKLINRFSGAQASFTFQDILGGGEALAQAIHLGTQAAGSDSHVLLYGESGTGKEMFAHAIHNQGPRRQGPFIAVNCGAIPRELIASELFGYKEGAFTGAHKGGRPGKFELAEGGTLFLDEIGDMPLDQQVSLLRVLQDKAVTRIGGDSPRVLDVRIICATHRDLLREVGKGNFREDLYYRLNVIVITLPPPARPSRGHPHAVPHLPRKGVPDPRGAQGRRGRRGPGPAHGLPLARQHAGVPERRGAHGQHLLPGPHHGRQPPRGDPGPRGIRGAACLQAGRSGRHHPGAPRPDQAPPGRTGTQRDPGADGGASGQPELDGADAGDLSYFPLPQARQMRKHGTTARTNHPGARKARRSAVRSGPPNYRL